MTVERLRLLHADKLGYRGGGVIDCDANIALAHPWEVRLRLSSDEVAGFERWQEEGTPLVVDIGRDRSGTAIVGRVLAGSTMARAVLDGQGLCPYPEHGGAGLTTVDARDQQAG